jgi:hypothetical protein
MREIEDSIVAQPAMSYFILFKHLMVVTEPTFIFFNLLLVDSMQNTTLLRVIDLDTGDEMGNIGYKVPPREYAPNKVFFKSDVEWVHDYGRF